MQMTQNNPVLQQKMDRTMQMTNGKDVNQIKQTIRNVSKEAGMSEEQLMGLANQFGLKF